jgi:hypothetical protein
MRASSSPKAGAFANPKRQGFRRIRYADPCTTPLEQREHVRRGDFGRRVRVVAQNLRQHPVSCPTDVGTVIAGFFLLVTRRRRQQFVLKFRKWIPS